MQVRHCHHLFNKIAPRLSEAILSAHPSLDHRADALSDALCQIDIQFSAPHSALLQYDKHAADGSECDWVPTTRIPTNYFSHGVLLLLSHAIATATA